MASTVLEINMYYKFLISSIEPKTQLHNQMKVKYSLNPTILKNAFILHNFGILFKVLQPPYE